VPTLGLEGGRINIVPVDFAVDALDLISHKPGIAAAGATTRICARDADKLELACQTAMEQGYRFYAYAVDLADMADCDRFIARLLEQRGPLHTPRHRVLLRPLI
jgi:hypothetical protein